MVRSRHAASMDEAKRKGWAMHNDGGVQMDDIRTGRTATAPAN